MEEIDFIRIVCSEFVNKLEDHIDAIIRQTKYGILVDITITPLPSGEILALLKFQHTEKIR